MAEFALTIEATIQAQNFDSAQTKAEIIKERVARTAEASEVRLKGKGDAHKE